MRIRTMVIGILLGALPANGQTGLAPVERADLARGYLRFENALRAHPPEAADATADLNRRFDAATAQFFALNLRDALRDIDELTLNLLPAEERIPARRATLPLRIVVAPRMLVVGQGELRVQVDALYAGSAIAAEPAVKLKLRLVTDSGAATVWEAPVEITPATPPHLEYAIPEAGRLKPGRYRLELQSVETVLNQAALYVVERTFDDTAAGLAKRLKSLRPDTTALRNAVSGCQARVGLLADEPSTLESAQFLLDPLALVSELEREVTSLERGENPYRNRGGDYWRIAVAGTERIPLRFYAPEQKSAGQPPLVVAFHGAGGDENMFMDGYGAGAIKRLADRHGFLVASPATSFFLGRPSRLAALLDALALDYDFDPRRVYVIGHSLGAAAATFVAADVPRRVAAVACIAGGGNWTASGLPPVQVVIAGLDSIIGAERLQKMAETAKAAGAPLDIRRIPERGHTLVVGEVLPDVWNWLQTHTAARQ